MKSFFLGVIVLFTIVSCQKTPRATTYSTYDFFVGTYTQNEQQGVNWITYNPNTLQFQVKELITGVQNPSFIQYNPTANHLFVSEEIGGVNGGKINSFGFDAKNQKIKKLSEAFTQGDHPCVITLSPDKKWLIAGNYSGGNIAAFKIQTDGILLESVQVLQHFGKSINKERQEKPHIHDLVFHPITQQLFVADLGTDRIYIYDFDSESTTPLTPSHPTFISVKKGSGPRHLVFNHTGEYLYVIQELTAEVSVYRLQENQIEFIQTISLNASSENIQIGSGAEIKISPNQKYVYASNRGKVNEIVVFAINQNNHQLVRIQNISCEGETPRSFEITPDGKFLFVANQDSHQIRLFEIQSNGKLKPTTASLSINQPTHIINKY